MYTIIFIVVFSHAHWLQVEVEAKDTQLQQQDGQIQQQGAELQEKATQISRQQRELQTLRVRKQK